MREWISAEAADKISRCLNHEIIDIEDMAVMIAGVMRIRNATGEDIAESGGIAVNSDDPLEMLSDQSMRIQEPDPVQIPIFERVLDKLLAGGLEALETDEDMEARFLRSDEVSGALWNGTVTDEIEE